MLRYFLKKAAVLICWGAVMFGFIYSSVIGDIELQNALSDSDFPRFLPGAPEAVSFPININTADMRELKALDGIGDSKAAAIIAYREENGGFMSVDELLNVSGIGEKTLENIRDYVTV